MTKMNGDTHETRDETPTKPSMDAIPHRRTEDHEQTVATNIAWQAYEGGLSQYQPREAFNRALAVYRATLLTQVVRRLGA